MAEQNVLTFPEVPTAPQCRAVLKDFRHPNRAPEAENILLFFTVHLTGSSSKRALKAWEIVLLALGSPIWASLLIAAFAVVLAAYAVVWSLIVSLWAIEISFAACSLAGIFAAFPFLLRGNVTTGIAMLGAGAFFAGLSILLFFGCKQATQRILHLTKKMALGMKSLFIGKEDVK